MQNSLNRQIVDSVLAGKNDHAQKLFELAMARAVQNQTEDYKAYVGEKMFEAAEDIGGEFMPVKRDFTIEAIDPSRKSERFPNGEPIKYKTNAYSPGGAYRNSVDAGHTNIKITDAVGNDVTDTAKNVTATSQHVNGFSGGVNESVDIDKSFSDFKQKVSEQNPSLTDNVRFVNHPDHPDHISAECNGRTLGVFNHKTGEHQLLGEDVNADLTAQRLADKKEADREQANAESAQKAPTIKDVVDILGNTVSVTDKSSVNQ